ncbi:hypothetical protein ES288_A07G140500v1 [Gossypium darwinii]|uniref:Secreted protein n=1 Tax=Gossypium darwinii TaxID=34276 RepID=A0A5D2FX50_GOSDA|nr:hypothetical protein ES288_A07G140500v1 [Gossypium darwinii]
MTKMKGKSNPAFSSHIPVVFLLSFITILNQPPPTVISEPSFLWARPFPIFTACRHAMASAANPEGTFSCIVVFEAKTSLLQSRTMTPE